MEHLSHPSAIVWQKRCDWFDAQHDELQGMGSYLLSEQACALIADVQAAFCTGAWAVVVIAAGAVVEAQLRLERPHLKNFKAQIDAVAHDGWLNADDLHWLRKRRNALVHADEEKPGLTVDHQWLDRDALEADAKHAVLLMFKVLYANPGT